MLAVRPLPAPPRRSRLRSLGWPNDRIEAGTVISARTDDRQHPLQSSRSCRPAGAVARVRCRLSCDRPEVCSRPIVVRDKLPRMDGAIGGLLHAGVRAFRGSTSRKQADASNGSALAEVVPGPADLKPRADPASLAGSAPEPADAARKRPPSFDGSCSAPRVSPVASSRLAPPPCSGRRRSRCARWSLRSEMSPAHSQLQCLSTSEPAAFGSSKPAKRLLAWLSLAWACRRVANCA